MSRVMAHMVAFYPDRRESLAVAQGLAEGRCAYLEVQFPFSDPTADGPDIQRACGAALAAGFSVDQGFKLVAELRGTVHVPLFIMSYANLLFTRGIDRFLSECAQYGARGVIVPDLPPGYDEGLFAEAARLGLAAVPVLSPSMKEERLASMASLCPEFIYATLRTGTTGARTAIDGAGLAFLSRVASISPGRTVKILGGFGVSTREQVESLQPYVHAVVVGSALVREVAKGGDVRASVRRKLEELALSSRS